MSFKTTLMSTQCQGTPGRGTSGRRTPSRGKYKGKFQSYKYILATSPEDCDEGLKQLGESTLTMFGVNTHTNNNKVSPLQIASTRLCLIVKLHLMETRDIIGLKKFFSNKRYLKLGVDLKRGLLRLGKERDWSIRSVIDIGSVVNQCQYKDGLGLNGLGLNEFVSKILKIRIPTAVFPKHWELSQLSQPMIDLTITEGICAFWLGVVVVFTRWKRCDHGALACFQKRYSQRFGDSEEFNYHQKTPAFLKELEENYKTDPRTFCKNYGIRKLTNTVKRAPSNSITQKHGSSNNNDTISRPGPSDNNSRPGPSDNNSRPEPSTSHRNTILKLEQKLAQLEVENNILRKNCKSEEKEKKKLTTQLGQLETLLEQISDDNEALRLSESKLKKKYSSSRDTINQLQGTNESLLQSAKVLRQEIVQVEQKLQTLTNQNLDDEKSSNIHELLTCPICREVLANPTTLECGHTFCYECLHRWYLTAKSCALCKKKVKHLNIETNIHLQSIIEANINSICDRDDAIRYRNNVQSGKNLRCAIQVNRKFQRSRH